MGMRLRYIPFEHPDGAWGVGLWDCVLKRIVDPLGGKHETEDDAKKVADTMNNAFMVRSI